MKEEIKKYNSQYKSIKNYYHNKISLQRAPTSDFNSSILKRITSNKIDLEKAHYEAELLLDEDEESPTIRNQSMFPRKNIGICQFFCHFCESIDFFYLILGILGAISCGISNPILTYINSNVYSSVGNTSEDRDSISAEEAMKLNVKETMEKNIKKSLIFGSITLVGDFAGYFFLGLISTRCLYNFKKKYFSIILSQEQGWFDSNNAFEFATRIQAQIECIQEGIGEEIVALLINCSIGLSSLIFAFLGSWKLSLVLLCFLPFIFILGFLINKYNTKGNTLVRETWENAGGIAEEILYNIKTVASFANFNYELKKFSEKVEISNKIELISNFKLSVLFTLLSFIGILIILVSALYGRTLIKRDYNSFRGRDILVGDITLSMNCIRNFINCVYEVTNNFRFISLALLASSDYFNIYERKPEMDLINSIEKPSLSAIRGNIEFNNVEFYYPSDVKKRLILKGINLKFESGKKIALIGQSGCGKTTIVNLINRLYDITNGEILLDGLDIRKYDIQYLRYLIGYVEQEPVLFNRSIRDNLIFGRENYLKEKGEDIEQLIKNACEEAYVSEFLNKLPNGLDYKVGLKGSKLSGGQKQRIAIARAILIKPKILILDEATSALDNKSEKIVQKALDNISKKNITTIIIAHRLSTIKNSDLIYVLKDGQIYEQGTHEELLEKGGYYSEIIRPQLLKDEIENQNKQEEYIRQISSVKRINTNEEVHFENREKEISKSIDDVNLNLCKVIKELLLNYKLDLFIMILTTIICGIFPPFQGLLIGKIINALNSNYETIRYDDSLKYAIIILIVGFFIQICQFFSVLQLYNLGINLSKIYRNKMMNKYLSFHISFFDVNRNSPGSLLSKMSMDTIQLRTFFKRIIGILILVLTIFFTALILGCYYEYRLTLIIIFFYLFLYL